MRSRHAPPDCARCSRDVRRDARCHDDATGVDAEGVEADVSADFTIVEHFSVAVRCDRCAHAVEHNGAVAILPDDGRTVMARALAEALRVTRGWGWRVVRGTDGDEHLCPGCMRARRAMGELRAYENRARRGRP